MRHVKTCCEFVVAPRHIGKIDVYCVCVCVCVCRLDQNRLRATTRTLYTLWMWSGGSAIFSSSYSTLGYGYIEARTDTTQQSGQTPDEEVEIKNITVHVNGYTETDTTGMLSPSTV